MDQKSKCHLTFNNFETSTSNAFHNLLTNLDFTDVTLACEDDEQIQAHKVILSSMSLFFHKILSNNPHQHPLIYLKDVRHNILERLIDFIYKGETELEKEDVNSFLKTAKELEISGLTQTDYGIVHVETDDQIQTIVKTAVSEGNEIVNEETGQEVNDAKETNLVEKPRIDLITKPVGSRYNCYRCDYKTNRKGYYEHHKTKPHIAENETRKFKCEDCDKKCNSKKALRYHIKSVHAGIRFPCDYCIHKATTPQGLKMHEASKHTDLDE